METEQSRIEQLKTEVLTIAKLHNIRTDNLEQVHAELQSRLGEFAKLNPTRGLNFNEILKNLNGIWHQL